MEFAKKEKNVTVALRRFVKLHFYNLFFIALIFRFCFPWPFSMQCKDDSDYNEKIK